MYVKEAILDVTDAKLNFTESVLDVRDTLLDVTEARMHIIYIGLTGCFKYNIGCYCLECSSRRQIGSF